MYIMLHAGSVPGWLTPRDSLPIAKSSNHPSQSPLPITPHTADSQTESAEPSHHHPAPRCLPSTKHHHAGTRCDSGNHAADSQTPPSSRHARQ
ncbi:hypothetical protein G6F40_013419 [Rhizopus arrhizus]|nr:hypothetical protein G6F40_013419 [Rhizopus arrhizus]